MDRTSYNPGDSAKVYINAPLVFHNAKLYLYSINDVIVDSLTTDLFPQSIANANPWENGFGYQSTFTYKIPNLKSGIYHWSGNDIGFIVKSAAKNADLTIIYPSNTGAAYNNAGGKSLYFQAATNTPKGTAVSFLRPNSYCPLDSLGEIASASPLFYCKSFLQWLDRSNYSFQLISDMDMDDYNEIKNSKILLIVGHSEYWTRDARTNFDAFVNSSKDAIVLSGNTMWWQVRYNADKTQLICYKDAATDTISDPLLKTTNWYEPSLHYSIYGSIGADFYHGANGQKPFNHGWYGYKITSSKNPLLEGSNLNYGDVLSCPTLEYDGAIIQWFHADGTPILDTATLQFCRVELIGYDHGNWFGSDSIHTTYGTFIACQKSRMTGRIINAASTNWCAQKGGFGGADSSTVRLITSTMINKLLARDQIFSANVTGYCSGISFLQSQNDIYVYPNPFQDYITITLPYEISSGKLQILDMLGRIIEQFEITSDYSDYRINLLNMPNGMYFMKLETGINTFQKKLIKNN